MKNTSIRTLAFSAATAALLGYAASNTASAQAFTIHIGDQGPPPERHDYRQWQSPDRSAVWIPGHNEWDGRHYNWVGGYYGYPPNRHSHWVAPSYSKGKNGHDYRAGHWSK